MNREHSLKTALDECVRFEDEVRAEMLAERARAEAAEAQRDRLAEALRDIVNLHCQVERECPNVIHGAARAALADVPALETALRTLSAQSGTADGEATSTTTPTCRS